MPSGSRDNSSLAFLPGNLTALLLLLYHSQLPPWQEMASKRPGQDIPQSHQQGENPRSGSDLPSLGQVSAPAHLWAEVSMRQGSACPVLTPGTRGVLGALERRGKPGKYLPQPSRSTTAEYGFLGANADSVTSEVLRLPRTTSRRHCCPVQLSRRLLSTY